MSFNISFIGASSGKRFVERKHNRSMGFSFPPTEAKDALFSMGVDSARTLAGDPTSSATGGGAVVAMQAMAAITSVQTLYRLIWFRHAGSNNSTGSMLVTVKTSRRLRIDGIDQRNFFFGRNTTTSELVALVDFLDRNDLSYTMPYADLVDLFSRFSTKCPGNRFICNVEIEL